MTQLTNLTKNLVQDILKYNEQPREGRDVDEYIAAAFNRAAQETLLLFNRQLSPAKRRFPVRVIRHRTSI